MQLPMININGTARSDLLEQYLEINRHLRHAIEAMQKAWPHGRDYQTLPLGGGPELQKALGEHSSRLLKIRQVMAEIETLAEHVV